MAGWANHFVTLQDDTKMSWTVENNLNDGHTPISLMNAADIQWSAQ